MTTNLHQLSAIMFSDIVGYTTLMGRNEEKGLELLKRNRQIQKPLIEKYHGVWIKEMGDGMMARFDSAYNATKCAIDIQKESQKSFKGQLRIGLHLGEIVIENKDIFGDDVNIASRIESLAEPGGIYISEPIQKALQSHADIQTRYLGSVELKNVQEEVKIHYVVGNGFTTPSRRKIKQLKLAQSGKIKRKIPVLFMLLIFLAISIFTINYWYGVKQPRNIEAIAVLPFENFTGKEEEQYFVDMMHDAVITELSQIGEMIVISRTSTKQFRDTNLTIPEIGRILDVDAVMESSVFKTGDSVLVQVQLIQTRPEEDHIWAQEFELETKHIFSFYGELARKVANEIEIQLTPQEEIQLTHHEEIDPVVYRTYLNGQYNWLKLSKEGIEKSKEYFDLVLEMAPDHALAHAGLSIYYVGYAQQGHISFFEAGPLADYHAKKALEANNQRAEVYHAAAFNAWLQWDLDVYIKYFRRALEINPNFSEVRAFMGQALVIENSPQEAIESVQFAIELDPLNDTYKALYAMCLYFTHHYDEALSFLLEAHKNNPKHPMLNSSLRAVYHQKQMHKDELDSWINKYTMNGDSLAVKELIQGNEIGGYELALQKLAEHLIRKFNYTPEFVPAWQIATIYTRIHKKEEALLWLEKAYGLHSISLPFIYIDPIFDYMRDDPKFKDLIRKLNLNT